MGSTNTPRHSLPAWFIGYQNTVGLASLVISLMVINGVVYGSGVVQNIENPGSWGIFGTIMFGAFFVAGTSMPGLAIRYGEHIAHGGFFIRLASLVGTLLFFLNEVWVSITERSVTTITTPADRWILQALHAPNLPFSPTVLAVSLSLSIAVIGWAIVAGPPPVVDHQSIEAKEQAKLIRTQYAAQRRQIQLASLGSSAHAFRSNLRGETPANTIPAYDPTAPDTDLANDTDDDDDRDDDDNGSDQTLVDAIPDEAIRVRVPTGPRIPRPTALAYGTRAPVSATIRAGSNAQVLSASR